MNYILFEDESRGNLLPLTFTKPVGELRCGILTLRQKWELALSSPLSYLTESYLSKKFKLVITDDNLLINSAVLPTPALAAQVARLAQGQALSSGKTLVAARTNRQGLHEFQPQGLENFHKLPLEGEIQKINFPWDIFHLNGGAMQHDFGQITQNRRSQPLSPTNNVLAPENIFVEEGARVEFATINAEAGPVYIGKNAKILEGALIRSPFALCESGVVKMGAKIYGATTVGPFSTAGGEIKNVVIAGYSNKGHEGYLGNSVLGEWCNLGADTNNSNLKNNYAEVRVWNYPQGRFLPSGLQFCGLIMGDHSKSGINTMFNTGSVVGVFANIYGSGFPRNFVPSFSWGGAHGFSVYQRKKAFEVALRVMKRKNKAFDEIEAGILHHVFEQTAAYRKF